MSKNTAFFDNIKKVLEQSGTINLLFLQYISKLNLNQLSFDSRCWYSRDCILRFMLLSKFLQLENVNRYVDSQWKKILNIGKDVFYKVRNSPMINWRNILYHQSLTSIEGIRIDDSKDSSAVPCFVIDDTDLPREGSVWNGLVAFTLMSLEVFLLASNV